MSDDLVTLTHIYVCRTPDCSECDVDKLAPEQYDEAVLCGICAEPCEYTGEQSDPPG